MDAVVSSNVTVSRGDDNGTERLEQMLMGLSLLDGRENRGEVLDEELEARETVEPSGVIQRSVRIHRTYQVRSSSSAQLDALNEALRQVIRQNQDLQAEINQLRAQISTRDRENGGRTNVTISLWIRFQGLSQWAKIGVVVSAAILVVVFGVIGWEIIEWFWPALVLFGERLSAVAGCLGDTLLGSPTFRAFERALAGNHALQRAIFNNFGTPNINSWGSWIPILFACLAGSGLASSPSRASQRHYRVES